MTKSTDKFREAVQEARLCLLDGPIGLGKAFEAVDAAAESAEAVGDSRALTLRGSIWRTLKQASALHEQTDEVIGKAERQFWALFGCEVNAMAPAPDEDYTHVVFDGE